MRKIESNLEFWVCPKCGLNVVYYEHNCPRCGAPDTGERKLVVGIGLANILKRETYPEIWESDKPPEGYR
jgi:hypothetical protein